MPVLVVGCAEGGPSDSAGGPLQDARRALERKDVEIRAFQWQLALLMQQLRDGQQRSDTIQRELFAQLQQATAANAALSERLKKAESERAALAVVPGEPGGRGARDDGRSVEALRRVLAASDARNAQIVEELAHIARILASRGQPAEPVPSKGLPPGDTVDPWGFGSRK